MGTPTGGPRDELPPVMLRAIPDTLQTNVPTDIPHLDLYFDEFVVLKDQAQNILISPPLTQNAVFSPTGTASRRVRVILNEELLPNTTYNINFGNAIQDNNEGNPLRDFSYVFSTGGYIDSLEVSGSVTILGERELKDNIVAGLYDWDESYTDSIIFQQKPLYVARVDSVGNYRFRYLREGDYRLIAFNDETPNLRFDPAAEQLAFHPTPVSAGDARPISLQLFRTEQAYRLVEAEQKGYGRIDFHFTGNPDSLRVVPIDPPLQIERLQHRAFADTARLYFDPSQLSESTRNVRMRFAVEYGSRTDTVRTVLYNTEDSHTLNLVLAKSVITPTDTLTYNTTYPIQELDASLVRVLEDSVSLDFTLHRRQENQVSVVFPVAFERNYRIEMLPGAVTDIFGLTHDTINTSINTRRQRDYGNLTVHLRDHPPHPFFLRLYDSKNVEVRSYYGRQSTIVYRNLTPGDYYMKLWVDENEDGRHNTGNFLAQRQPEPVIIYPGIITIRAYWDLEETWFLQEESAAFPPTNPPPDPQDADDDLQQAFPPLGDPPIGTPVTEPVEEPQSPRNNIPRPARPTLD
ncbi:MAG: Ig-like domain-containing protein [Weeksellaceae bacterium]|nr:Ig-like domain-containing protein [Weeksellaceae bacterium]